jgi:lysophospholipase L1-like esterase
MSQEQEGDSSAVPCPLSPVPSLGPLSPVTSSQTWVFRILALIGGLAAGGCVAGLAWGVLRAMAPTAIERANAGFEQMVRSTPPSTQRLLDAAGFGTNERLVCSANFDGTLVFSSRVMERHPTRGYRFRPAQSNLWVFPVGFPFQIIVPDTESVRAALSEAGTPITSREQINAQGCRGSEWDDLDSCDYRILVVGDSFTEGILVSEDQTFCLLLERKLREASDRPVLVANAGVIGYSTEQELYTIEELAPQLRPQLVVLCFYANDVHSDHHRVLESRRPKGDWKAAEVWLDRAAQYCRQRGIRFVVAVIPDRTQLHARGSRQRYQHRLEEISARLGLYLIDPDERFLAHRQQELYLKQDAHFGPIGHELFAQVLSEHIRGWIPAPKRENQDAEVQ